jgi:hypothetical protein
VYKCTINSLNPNARKHCELMAKNSFRHKNNVLIMVQDVFAFVNIQGPLLPPGGCFPIKHCSSDRRKDSDMAKYTQEIPDDSDSVSKGSVAEIVQLWWGCGCCRGTFRFLNTCDASIKICVFGYSFRFLNEKEMQRTGPELRNCSIYLKDQKETAMNYQTFDG